MRLFLSAIILLIAIFVSPQQDKDIGIGPVKKLTLGPLDKKLAQQGMALFNNKCLQCHDLDQKRVGPTLRDVTKRRTPEFIVNYLLNTAQMQQEDQTIKDLMDVYLVPMTPPGFNQDQARAVLEYLRSVVK